MPFFLGLITFGYYFGYKFHWPTAMGWRNNEIEIDGVPIMASLTMVLGGNRRTRFVPRVRNYRAEGLAALEFIRMKDRGHKSAIIMCPDPIREWRVAISTDPHSGGRLFSLCCESRIPARDARALSQRLAEMNVNEIDWSNDRDGFVILWHEPAIRLFTLADIESSSDLNLLDDGRVSDEFGEILGIVLPEGVTEPATGEIISDGLAKWVLMKLRRHAARRTSAEAVLIGIQEDIKRRQDEVLATLEQTEDMIELRATEAGCLGVIKEADKGADFFVARYIRDLGKWAAAQLGSGSVRTWKEPEGNIQVTKVGESLEIANEEDAIALLEKLNEKDAIKKTVLKSKISDELKAAVSKGDLVDSGFAWLESTQRITIDTGCGVKHSQTIPPKRRQFDAQQSEDKLMVIVNGLNIGCKGWIVPDSVGNPHNEFDPFREDDEVYFKTVGGKIISVKDSQLVVVTEGASA